MSRWKLKTTPRKKKGALQAGNMLTEWAAVLNKARLMVKSVIGAVGTLIYSCQRPYQIMMVGTLARPTCAALASILLLLSFFRKCLQIAGTGHRAQGGPLKGKIGPPWIQLMTQCLLHFLVDIWFKLVKMDLCSLIESSWGRVPSDLLYLHSGSQQLTPGGQPAASNCNWTILMVFVFTT